MAKIDTELVAMILRKHAGIKAADVDDLVKQINTEAKNQGTSGSRGKGPKKQFVLVVSDPEGKLKGVELTGWAVQIEEDQSIKDTVERIEQAGMDFRHTKRGRKLKPATVGEVFELGTTKCFKERGIFRKHREAAFVITTNNQLPKDKPDGQA